MLRGKRWNYHWIWGLHFQTQICSYHCPHIPLRCFLEVEILNLWFFFFAWLHFHSFRGNLKSIWEWFLDFGSGESMRIPDPPAQESQKEHDALSAELKQEQQHLASQRRLRPAAPRSFGSCWFHVPQSVPQRISKMDNVHFDSFHHTTCTPLAHQGDSMMRWSTRRTELLPCCADCDVLRPSKRLSWCSQMLVFFSCLMHIFYWMCWGSKCPPAARFHVLGSSVSFLCMFELRSSLFVD